MSTSSAMSSSTRLWSEPSEAGIKDDALNRPPVMTFGRPENECCLALRQAAKASSLSAFSQQGFKLRAAEMANPLA